MKKLILLIVPFLLLTGCDNRKCVKSHKEKSTCVWYQTIRLGNFTTLIPHYYDCEKIICDEYEEVEE